MSPQPRRSAFPLPSLWEATIPELGPPDLSIQTQELRLKLNLDSTPPHGENQCNPPARGKITETARGPRSPQSWPFPHHPVAQSSRRGPFPSAALPPKYRSCRLARWGRSGSQLRPYQVSWLLNFLVTTLPSSRPRRSAIFWDKSWWELPLKILIFGILANYPRYSLLSDNCCCWDPNRSQPRNSVPTAALSYSAILRSHPARRSKLPRALEAGPEGKSTPHPPRLADRQSGAGPRCSSTYNQYISDISWRPWKGRG